MSDEGTMDTSAVPPPVALLQMMTGYRISQAVYVAAKLGLADLLARGPVGDADLAAATDSHAPSRCRLLRALASVGVFTEAVGPLGLVKACAPPRGPCRASSSCVLVVRPLAPGR